MKQIFKRTLCSILIATASAVAVASPYDDLILRHSAENGLDPNLVTAIITRESAFNANARSSKDARGLMQVIPGTARFVGIDPSRLYEPEQSIIAGTRYLAFLKDRYNGDITKMIAGYNAGHGAVDKFGGIPPYRETKNYVRFVSGKYMALSGYAPSNYNTTNSYGNSNSQYSIQRASATVARSQQPTLSVAQQQVNVAFNNSTTIFVKKF